jgi:hypothetical protein
MLFINAAVRMRENDRVLVDGSFTVTNTRHGFSKTY